MVTPKPLHVMAQLSILALNHPIAVHADGSVITVDLPGVWTSWRLLRQHLSGSSRAMRLTQLHQGLQLADLTLEVRMAQRVVATLTPQSHGNLWARLLGIVPFEVRPIPLLLALLSR